METEVLPPATLIPGVQLWTCFLISRVRGLDSRVSEDLPSINSP